MDVWMQAIRKMYVRTQLIKIIPLLVVIVIFCAQIQQVQATTIIERVGDGYGDGKEQGRQDYRNGNGHNDNCPPNVGVQYCIGWVTGYNVGHGTLKIADD